MTPALVSMLKATYISNGINTLCIRLAKNSIDNSAKRRCCIILKFRCKNKSGNTINGNYFLMESSQKIESAFHVFLSEFQYSSFAMPFLLSLHALLVIVAPENRD